MPPPRTSGAARSRLADSEARARLIVGTAHDAFMGIDSSGHIVSWNTRSERIFGVWGENVHPLRAITVGVNTHFNSRRAARR